MWSSVVSRESRCGIEDDSDECCEGEPKVCFL